MNRSEWLHREAKKARVNMRYWALEWRCDSSDDSLFNAEGWRDMAIALAFKAEEEKEAA